MNSEKIFNDVASDYETLLEQNLSQYGKDISYYAEYKIKFIREKISNEPENILEFGCGIGRNVEYLKKYFPDSHITGSDISSESLLYAQKQKQNEQASFLNVNELTGKNYDLIFIAGVFHHILPEKRRETMGLLFSLLSQEGRMFVFEHNPYNPLTRKAVSSCPFDEGVVLLKPREFYKLIKQTGLQIVKIRYCLFFPSILKKLAFLERFMHFISLGGQYVVELKKI